MKTLAAFLAESQEHLIQEVKKADLVTTNHYNFKEWKQAAKSMGFTIQNTGRMTGTPERVDIVYATHKDSMMGGQFFKGKTGSSSWNYGHLTHVNQELQETYSGLDGTQYGSNEGGVHTDSAGKKYYIKYPKTEEQARVEVATAKIYGRMGIQTVNPRTENINGRTAIVSDWNDNLKILSKSKLQELAKQPKHALELAKMRHAAVITGNRDIVGLEYDNIGHDTTTDRLISLDQGGSMHYRAQGAKKPFERDIEEHESFDNPRYTTQHIFSSAVEHHPDILRTAIDHVKQLKDEDIRSIMTEHGLDDHKETVVDRKNLLLKKY